MQVHCASLLTATVGQRHGVIAALIGQVHPALLGVAFNLPVEGQRLGARDGGDGIKLQLGLPVIGIELAPVVHLHLSGIDGGKGEGITDAITPLALPAAGGHITGLGRQGAQQQGKQVVAGHTRAP